MNGSIRHCLTASLNQYRNLDLSWRARIRRLVAGIDHLSTVSGAKLFWHIAPVTADYAAIDWNDQQLIDTVRYLPLFPNGQTPNYSRINLDGYLGYRTLRNKPDEFTNYYQVFWDGSIEVCDTDLLAPYDIGRNVLRHILLFSFEWHFVNSLKVALQFSQKISLPLPLRLYVAMVGVKGYAARLSQHSFPEESHLIDRDELLFDPILFSDWETNPAKSMRPLFDQLWNAAGYPHSLSYDEDGHWKPQVR